VPPNLRTQCHLISQVTLNLLRRELLAVEPCSGPELRVDLQEEKGKGQSGESTAKQEKPAAGRSTAEEVRRTRKQE
jgi:hypothetical protein